MSIDWSRLRPLNGSQESGFEELCCQLASGETVPSGSAFFRKGAPDAGVECYWRLPNGEELAWQSKFFRESPGDSQWSQMDQSVQTAIEKHPRMTRYTFCLPIDLPDARISGQVSARQKWDRHVAKWGQLAADHNMLVSFCYWGQAAIASRLSEEKNRGRHWFWFNKDQMSNAWLAGRVEEAIANAGDRYSPEIHIEVPLRSSFDILGRTPEFFAQLTMHYSSIRLALGKLRRSFDDLTDGTQHLLGVLEPWVMDVDEDFIRYSPQCEVPLEETRRLAEKLMTQVSDQIGAVDRKSQQGQWQLHYLYQLHGAIGDLLSYIESPECRLCNLPALLLVGKAGQGKTHLLCDVARHDTEQSRPRLLFHGEHFARGEPWTQMLSLLGLTCTRDEFLGALNACAQANQCRVLVFIDALNEGEGNRLWYDHLPGMLATLANHPWLGICVSTRSDYERLVIPDSIRGRCLVRLEHSGFGEMADRARALFFEHYGIAPTTPHLEPEFENPLFLKLFCRAVNNAGVTSIPLGVHGLTSVFEFWADSLDRKLSRPQYLNYDLRSQIVHNALDLLADRMAAAGTDRVPLAEAKSILDSLLPSTGYHSSLLYRLESESAITVVPEYGSRRAEWTESVRFTHQRFSDHLVARRLLETHLDQNDPGHSFIEGSVLRDLLEDERACWTNRGLLQALAIQVPELVRTELPDLVPHLAGTSVMREVFVDSIVWRHPDSFSLATLRYVNDQVIRYRGTSSGFWNVLVTISARPGHPLNADLLHENLSRYTLPERDQWWSIFLHEEWSNQRAVRRLVDWAWAEDDKSMFSGETIRLAGQTLAWFLTTANRFLRDRATKAMVRLFEHRIDELVDVMDRFVEVNDPYVTERLYAIAYGCAMRSHDSQAVLRLARAVYQWSFDTREPLPHLLAREYARGVVELASYMNPNLEVDMTKVRPPYKSAWPSIAIPGPDELATWGEWQDGMPEEEWSRVHLYTSLMSPMGDFSRYVVGDLDEWSSERLDEPHRHTRREICDDFEHSLTDHQLTAWNEFLEYPFQAFLNAGKEQEANDQDGLVIEKKTHDSMDALEKKFLRTLGRNSRKAKLYQDVIKPCLAEPNAHVRENRFDGKLARRWMLKRILDLGWTVERFGKFDGSVRRYSSHGREPKKAERIGKKYQWIVYNELLARLADNFRLRDDKSSVRGSTYEGRWSIPHLRPDIDPSNLLRKTPGETWGPHTNAWWFPTRYSSWESPNTDVAWLKDTIVPEPAELIAVQDRSNMEWLTLNGYYSWQQPSAPGEDRFELPRRELWFILHGYIIKKADAKTIMSWAARQHWSGRWMPESSEWHKTLLGEFFWAPEFSLIDPDDYSRTWSRGIDREVPVEVLVANDEYHWSGGSFDCSVDDSMSMYVPCRFIVEGMQLNWRGVEGHWFDQNGQLIALDPSVREDGPGGLLVRKDALREFLGKNNLTIFWTVLGEKQIIGGRMTREDYKGYLSLDGAYVLNDDGTISGTTCAQYVSPGQG